MTKIIIKLLNKFLKLILVIEIIKDSVTFINTLFQLLKNKYILTFKIILCMFIYITLFFDNCYSYSLSPLKKYYATICYPEKNKFFHFLTKWKPRVISIYQRWDGDEYYDFSKATGKLVFKSEVLNITNNNMKWELDNHKILISNKILNVNFNEYCNESFSRPCNENYDEYDDIDMNEVKKNKSYYSLGKW
ncbi:hypothetical protein [Fluviispira vulneris]|uniref:hypothetical protein n=1 Tax=Fluviispira vulneris TaxID=2763012 RepID=UPI001648E0AC|nr:hypothetical protein [Fluviispira vulneris]